jgi:hypothetical protein
MLFLKLSHFCRSVMVSILKNSPEVVLNYNSSFEELILSHPVENIVFEMGGMRRIGLDEAALWIDF